MVVRDDILLLLRVGPSPGGRVEDWRTPSLKLVYIYIYIDLCIYLYLYLSLYIYILYVCIFIYLYLYLWGFRAEGSVLQLCPNSVDSMYVYMYIYIYVYIYYTSRRG